MWYNLNYIYEYFIIYIHLNKTILIWYIRASMKISTFKYSFLESRCCSWFKVLLFFNFQTKNSITAVSFCKKKSFKKVWENHWEQDAELDCEWIFQSTPQKADNIFHQFFNLLLSPNIALFCFFFYFFCPHEPPPACVWLLYALIW